MKTILLVMFAASAFFFSMENSISESNAKNTLTVIDSNHLFNLIDTADILSNTDEYGALLLYDSIIQLADLYGYQNPKIYAQINKAQLLLFIDSIDAADELINKAISNNNFYSDYYYPLKGFIVKAEIQNYLGEFDSALYYLNAAKPYGNDEYYFIGRIYYDLAQLYSDQNNYDSMIQLYSTALENFKLANEPNLTISSYAKIGEAYKLKGNLDSSYGILMECDSMINVTPNLFNITIAQAYLDIGDIYKAKSLFKPAIEYYEKCIPLFEREYDFYNLAIVKQRIGNLLMDKGNYVDGKIYLYSMLDICIKYQYNNLIPRVYNSIANIENRSGDYEKALENANAGIAICEQTNNIATTWSLLISKATALSGLGNHDSALQYFIEADVVSERVSVFTAKFLPKYSLAAEYQLTNNLILADSFANIALAIAETAEQQKEISMANNLLYKINLEKGNYKAALENYIAGKIYKDSLRNIENNFTIETLNKKYQLAEKDKMLVETNLRNELVERNLRLQSITLLEQQTQNRVITLINDSLQRTAELSNQAFELEKAKVKQAEDQKSLALLKAQSEKQQRELEQQKRAKQKNWFVLFSILFFVIAFSIIILVKQIGKKKVLQIKNNFLSYWMNTHFIANNIALNKGDTRENPERAILRGDLLSSITSDIFHFAKIDKITIREELNIVEKFIKIEGLRLENRFNYSIKIVPENAPLHDIVMKPPLAIQTLVENTIKHAVEASNYIINIEVAINVYESFIKINVIDDGPGFDKDITLESILQNKEPSAIQIIYERLRIECKKKKIKDFIKINHINQGSNIELIIPSSVKLM